MIDRQIFEELLLIELEKLPYEKHLDDGQYNDGQIAGFELGARWTFEMINKKSQDSHPGPTQL